MVSEISKNFPGPNLFLLRRLLFGEAFQEDTAVKGPPAVTCGEVRHRLKHPFSAPQQTWSWGPDCRGLDCLPLNQTICRGACVRRGRQGTYPGEASARWRSRLATGGYEGVAGNKPWRGRPM